MKYTLSVCFLIACLLYRVHGKVAAKTEKTRPNQANLQFHPCRTSTRMSAWMKKRLTKVGIFVLTFCGLRISTILSSKWGSAENIGLMILKFVKLTCMGIRASYFYHGDSNGRLPKDLTANASLVYDFILRMERAFFTEESSSPYFCKRHPKSKRLFCVPKASIYDYIEVTHYCIQEAMKNTLPDYADGAIHGLGIVIKTMETNGLMHFASGLA